MKSISLFIPAAVLALVGVSAQAAPSKGERLLTKNTYWTSRQAALHETAWMTAKLNNRGITQEVHARQLPAIKIGTSPLGKATCLRVSSPVTRSTEPGVKSFLPVDPENLPYKPAEASRVEVRWGVNSVEYLQAPNGLSGVEIARAIARTLERSNRYMHAEAAGNSVRVKHDVHGLLDLKVRYVQPDLLTETHGQTHTATFDDRFRLRPPQVP